MSLRMSDRRAFATQLFASGFTMLMAIGCSQQAAHSGFLARITAACL